jgi:hypothetical protein
MKKPYLKSYGKFGEVYAWVVDGEYIRAELDEEFTDGGQHYNFSFIPENEIWVDEEKVPGETQFYVDALLVERRLMKAGKSYKAAAKAGDAVERRERTRSGNTNAHKKKNSLLKDKYYVKELGDTDDGVTVYIVDGEKVRDELDTDFTEGGNDLVYSFVPKKEVWVDNDVEDDELNFIIFHELYERNLIKSKGLDYNQAHKKASHKEQMLRKHPSALDESLAEVGWNKD